ncbi:MAG: RDD family protein [Rhizobiaceae bacterium]|nr:RDD family protein [Rhizobiaceae bacterium]
MNTQTANQNSYNAIDVNRMSEVRRRRVLAFFIDYLCVGVLSFLAGIMVFFAGIITLGAAWLIYLVLVPLVAIVYIGMTLGGPKQATIGMQMFSLKIEADSGKPVDPMTAIMHGIIFWAAHIMLTPFMLLVSMFSTRKRLVQDILLGTVILRV